MRRETKPDAVHMASRASQDKSPLPKPNGGSTPPSHKIDRRSHKRESLQIKVSLQLPGKHMSSISSDISPEGLRTTLPVALRPGTPLALHFSFGELCFLRVSGQVAFCASQGLEQQEIGIKFSAFRDWGKQILYSVIKELKANQTTLATSFATIHVSKDNLALEGAALSLATSLSGVPAPHISETEADTPVPHPADVDRSKRSFSKRAKRYTPNPPWVIAMNRHLDRFRQAIWQSRLVQDTSTGELSLAQVRGWSIQFYPFVEYFPQFMATYLAKAPDPMSRAFLIDNLRVEKRHADQWLHMAGGFGVPKRKLFETPILPEVEALTHWMWSITNRGTFVEAVAAANFAIEGVTQGIAATMVKGFHKYDGTAGVTLGRKAYDWMEAHAHYDDLHPHEALEIIKLHAASEELQEKVTHAAQRSLEYLHGALEACYWAYLPEPAIVQA